MLIFNVQYFYSSKIIIFIIINIIIISTNIFTIGVYLFYKCYKFEIKKNHIIKYYSLFSDLFYLSILFNSFGLNKLIEVIWQYKFYKKLY